MSTLEGNRLRNEARIKYGPQLRNSFKKLDVDQSGFASVDEMSKFLAKKGFIKNSDDSISDFNASMTRYLNKLNYGKEKPGELSEDEFVKFWADLYALFDKIDKNGDGFISISECCQYLLERKIKHQLTKNDLLSEVKRFFNKVDTDRNGKITLTEFFVKLPDLELQIINKTL
ncbi:Oidioi.mRNA.OKI2018_I69.chr1.g133.t1.cds [Oikopleura dioica]|uniref:Oidioi.mRNA.OKI2018_I69.chr1.g133.t1.cds n=1 Tax=Oikopleura dioica TaxID=34765 RepID=A0ABN7SIX3_OIKDI|nr:Oidioi.mRNA.OKI2018_I69.chr1.g133.t1.cds [Oikopleura dioica]